MQANLVRIELLLTRKDVEAIDQTVQDGEYATRTDAIRTAVRRLVDDKDRVAKMEKAFALIDQRLKEKGIDPKELIEEFGRRSSREAEELIERAKSKHTHRGRNRAFFGPTFQRTRTSNHAPTRQGLD